MCKEITKHTINYQLVDTNQQLVNQLHRTKQALDQAESVLRAIKQRQEATPLKVML